jgi:hypothetical protein
MTPVVEVEETSTLSLSAYGKARFTIQGSPLSAEELRKPALSPASEILRHHQSLLEARPFAVQCTLQL